MLNIFDGITKLEPKLIQSQLVSLEELTTVSLVSEVSQKATIGIVNIVNSFRKIAKVDDIVIESTIPLEDRIRNKNALLEQMSKEELELRLQKELVEKINSFNKMKLHNITRESISVNVIEIATKCFSEIPRNLTPAKKADAVYDTFNARLIVKINNVYQNATKDEKKELLYDLKLDNKDINPPFSREIISFDTLSFLFGEGNYLLSEEINNAITIRDKNQLMYELFAQLVWLSVMMCGGKISFDEKLLPNFTEESELQDKINYSDVLHEHIENTLALNRELEACILRKNENDNIAEENEKKIKRCNNKIKFENNKIKKLDNDLHIYEQQIHNFPDSHDTDIAKSEGHVHKDINEDYQKTIFNINRINDIIRKAYTSIEEMNKLILELEENSKNIETENDKLMVEFETKEQMFLETNNVISALVDKEEQRLKPLYEETYYKFVFDENVIRSVAKNYNFSEYESVENALMELHEMHDATVLHNRNSSTSQVAAFNFLFFSQPNTTSKILYRTLAGVSEAKTVFILSISKVDD